MDLELAGKRALVTGSSSGIGAEIARMLAAEGVKVVVHGRHQERTRTIAAEIETAGGEAMTVLGDLTADDDTLTVVEASREAFGGIDILVNNVGGPASVAHPTWFDASLEEWAENYRHNTLAAVCLILAFVPEMRERRWLGNAVHQTVDRLGRPRDIAAAVCFLASPLSDFMTGTTFRIDGGATPTI